MLTLFFTTCRACHRCTVIFVVLRSEDPRTRELQATSHTVNQRKPSLPEVFRFQLVHLWSAWLNLLFISISILFARKSETTFEASRPYHSEDGNQLHAPPACNATPFFHYCPRPHGIRYAPLLSSQHHSLSNLFSLPDSYRTFLTFS